MVRWSRFGDRAAFRQKRDRVIYFFPFQLLILHLKKDLLLMGFWAMLFGYVLGFMGVKYGIPNVFLFPEYFGTVSFWSYALVGVSVGGFITGFNLYTYTLHGYRFPFLATIQRPFLKFNLNNAIIPAAFVITYLIASARLQYNKELIPVGDIVIHLAGFLVGIAMFLLLALAYFMRTNTDIRKLRGKEPEDHRPVEPMADIRGPRMPLRGKLSEQREQLRLATRWLRREQRIRKWRVDTYLTPPLRLALARSSAHYDKELLRTVLWQNHINGSIFEVVMVLSFLVLGAFSDHAVFAIPTAASVFLLFTMGIMVLSALYSWFKGWTITVLAGVILCLDLLSGYSTSFLADNSAYGLDYGAPPARYDTDRLRALAFDDTAVTRSKEATLSILEKWAEQNAALTPNGEKPRLVIVATSGGGLRSMLWTFRAMQYADSLVGGTLMDRTALITGSSGGIIGAAYYRQLAYQAGRADTIDMQDRRYLENMSGDILNPVMFSFVTNDLFIRYRRVSDGRFTYTRDRGYSFEKRMNELTGGMLDVRLSDLAGPEAAADMPMMVITPTTINDGRRLVISASPAAYLSDTRTMSHMVLPPEPESVDFVRFFDGHEAMQLKLTSALRMNATFPYITPMVTLPSEPPMRVMDAGIRDNYGYRATVQFLYTFRDWLKDNTSGVVILQMRDKQKILEVHDVGGSFLGRLLDPARNVYNNVVRIQDQDYDVMMQQASAWAGMPVEVVDIELRHHEDDEISLSWHLTALERTQLLRTIRESYNKNSFDRFAALIGDHVPMSPMVPVNDGDRLPAPAADPALRP